MSRNLSSIIRRPLITEKSALQKELSNQVAFEVDRRANKIEILRAVEAQFGVKVVRVRTANFRGKKIRYGRTMGRKSDWKRALVTLAPGERIEFFEGA